MITLDQCPIGVPAPAILHDRPAQRPFVGFAIAEHEAAISRDAFDYEDPPEVHVPDPEHVPLFNVERVISEAEASAKEAARRISQPDSAAVIENARLRAELRRAADLIEMLQREMQTAINDGVCGSYVTAHLDRVERTCGVVVPEGYR